MNITKAAIAYRIKEMQYDAKREACENGIAFTPYPLAPYVERKIKEAFAKDGTRTRMITNRVFMRRFS